MQDDIIAFFVTWKTKESKVQISEFHGTKASSNVESICNKALREKIHLKTVISDENELI
jgi:hypothetical protein